MADAVQGQARDVRPGFWKQVNRWVSIFSVLIAGLPMANHIAKAWSGGWTWNPVAAPIVGVYHATIDWLAGGLNWLFGPLFAMLPFEFSVTSLVVETFAVALVLVGPWVWAMSEDAVRAGRERRFLSGIVWALTAINFALLFAAGLLAAQMLSVDGVDQLALVFVLMPVLLVAGVALLFSLCVPFVWHAVLSAAVWMRGVVLLVVAMALAVAMGLSQSDETTALTSVILAGAGAFLFYTLVWLFDAIKIRNEDAEWRPDWTLRARAEEFKDWITYPLFFRILAIYLAAAIALALGANWSGMVP